MAQYCRYCDHMLVGGIPFCEIKEKFYPIEHLTHTNQCPHFLRNDIDALRRNPKGYQPREDGVECDPNQTTIFDFLE